jgi:hypothetical protein
MKIQESYLSYLYSEDPNIREGFVGNLVDITKSAGKSQIKFAAGLTAAIIGLKALQLAFSKARQRCGSAFLSAESAPARKICVDKEKLKLFKQKLVLLKKADIECDKTKNPEECHLKFEQKINNTRINIEITQQDLKSHMGEIRESIQKKLNEAGMGAFLGRAATVGFEWFVLGMIVDKALFTAWRSALGLFSSASRKCGTFKKGDERSLCLSKIRLQALLQKKAVLDRVLAKCTKNKDPEKCKEKISSEVEKNNSRIEMEQNNIIIIDKRIRLEKLKLAMKKGIKLR